MPLYPYGNYETKFVFDESDHDFGEKTFLGRTGDFNGEDIIDIICEERATAYLFVGICTISLLKMNLKFLLGVSVST